MKKWRFLIENEWEIHKDWFAVDFLALNLQRDFIAITIFGFTFIMEK